jgi:hypothetical protein
MAEICVDCMEKRFKKRGGHFSKREWVISRDFDLCEWCGEYKPVVVKRKVSLLLKLMNIIFFRRYWN